MAYKKIQAKIGTHASCTMYLYHGQKPKIGESIYAASRNDFESLLPCLRSRKGKDFYNSMWKRFHVEDMYEDGFLFLSL